MLAAFFWLLFVTEPLSRRSYGYKICDRPDGAAVWRKGRPLEACRGQLYPERTTRHWPELQDLLAYIQALDGHQAVPKRNYDRHWLATNKQRMWKKFSAALQKQLACMNDMNSMNCIARGFGR